MSELTWTPTRVRLADLAPWERNPKRMSKAQAARLEASTGKLGRAGVLLVGPPDADGKRPLYDGHQRAKVWGALYGPATEVVALEADRTLTDEERRATSLLTVTAAASFDWDALASWDVGELVTWGLDTDLLAQWNDDAANLREMLSAETEMEDDVGEEVRALYVPDAIFPSDNEWDVPTLLPELQADFLELPLTKWGEGSRKAAMRGTYHFYTEDYKFEALWEDPLDLVNSSCVAIVEPNTSTNDQMPTAVALWQIYRKRWLARYLQEFGIKVWVDLNVDPKWARLNLLGIPQGWCSFCTRGLDRTIDDLSTEYGIACEVAAPNAPRFLVYGGGKATEALCKKRGWQWLPENMRVKEGKAEADYG